MIPSIDVAFSLPSENDFRTSLLMPKMADRFSLLRMDEQYSMQERRSPVVIVQPQQQQQPKQGQGQVVQMQMQMPEQGMGNANYPHSHGRDLSILEEFDEDEEELPVRPWARHENNHSRNGHRTMQEGMSKDEFMRVRTQEGNGLFGGRQRTFKIKTDDGQGNGH